MEPSHICVWYFVLGTFVVIVSDSSPRFMIHLLVVDNKHFDSHFFTYISQTDNTTEVWSVNICSHCQLLKIYDNLRSKILSLFKHILQNAQII